MERRFNLKADDGAVIPCILNTRTKQSDTVVVFVHGLGGSPFDHLFFNAAREFPKEGIDTCRFALYWLDKGNRTLTDCSVRTHARDLERVLRYLQPTYTTISVVGFSLGSPTVLSADLSGVLSVVLWDPSHLAQGIREHFDRVSLRGKKVWLSHSYIEYVLSDEMVSEWEWFNGSNELELVRALGKPLKVIAAGKGDLTKGSRAYVRAAEEPKSLTIIKGATHCFDEEGKEEEVFKETLAWVKEHR